ncbi:PilC/PilY family type IV pilus protein, partial [Leclercia adecarboxylata]
PTARKVFFGTNTDVLPFSSNSVTLESLCDLSPSLYPGMARCSAGELTDLGATRANAVSYLLGERSLETRRGGRFRDRTTVLGDIINSSPVISAPIDDYGYRGLDQGLGASYATYLETKRSGRYMVYVGANDGMLHAFDGGMGVSGTMDSSGGAETFAYIPATSMG